METTARGLKVGDKVYVVISNFINYEATVVAIATGGGMREDMVKLRGMIKKGFFSKTLKESEEWHVEKGIRKISK